MVQVDRRIAARRRQVAEVQARSAMTKLILLLSLAAAAAGAVWLLRSPYLSVQDLRVEGIDPIVVEETLLAQGVEAGRPLISLRPAEIEAALRADPRVAAATVTREWPQTVRVVVTPREPVAWADLSGTWARVGVDGVVIDTADQPAAGLPRMLVPGVGVEPAPEALAALEFLDELDASVAYLVTIAVQGEELWATLPGLTIRLGRPAEMTAKARALEAVLASGIREGSIINLLAPTRPAVLTPEAAAALVAPAG